ncbi:MAG: hypothetical protein RBR71_11480 [Gudongella sp.]|nr:hypothetical protein [Gudongella sp.]
MAFYAVDNLITHDQQKFNKTVGMIKNMSELIEDEVSNRFNYHNAPYLMVINVFTKSDMASPEEQTMILDKLNLWLTYKNAYSISFFTSCIPKKRPTLVPLVALIACAMHTDSYERGLGDKLKIIKNKRFENLQSDLIDYLKRERPDFKWWSTWKIKI